MPIIIPKEIPAYEVLSRENIFLLDKNRAIKQDIRALKIEIVNLMPQKIKTEIQLLRRISNTPLQVDIDFIRTSSYIGKNTNEEYLDRFYLDFKDIKDKKYDAMIITGAPVEKLEYKEVLYWKELEEIMNFAKKNVYSTMFICWASQAALYHFYGIRKYELKNKLFGVYKYSINNESVLTKGFDDEIFTPHSRHSYCRKEDIEKVEDLKILSYSKEKGVNILSSLDERFIFSFGHGEYDTETLQEEYIRDLNKNLKIEIPENYYIDNEKEKGIITRWKAHSSLFFSNWLNYCVYQRTPYEINDITEKLI